MLLYKTLRHLIETPLEDISKNGIYYICHIDKPNIFYIGSTCRNLTLIDRKKCKEGMYSRWIEHFSKLRKNNHYSKYLQRVVNKYGLQGLRFGVIKPMENNTIEEILSEELLYITLYDSVNNGYNSNSNPTTTIHSEETRKKFSERMKLYNPMFNIDSKNKSRSSRNKKISEKKHILQYTLEGEFIKKWSSCNDAAKEYNVDGSNINRALNGFAKSSANFIWVYDEKDVENKIKEVNTRKPFSDEANRLKGEKNKQPVLQFTKQGEFVKEFDSVKEAYDETQISNISRAARGIYKSVGGYVWKYKN